MIAAARSPTGIFVPIIVLLIAAQAAIEFAMGRLPMCACGTIRLWAGVVQGPENSQQIFDWYSFSHVIHGFVFYGVMWLIAPRSPVVLRLACAVAIECSWELLENSDFIIDRYRAGTISLNYRGDSIINSVSDTMTMMFGFGLAYWLPAWASAMLAVLLEVFVAYEIRDNLTLNVIMLIYPFDAIRAWQGGA